MYRQASRTWYALLLLAACSPSVELGDPGTSADIDGHSQDALDPPDAIAEGRAEEGGPDPVIVYRPYTVLDLTLPSGAPVFMADPAVLKVDRTWYLYGTTDKGFEVWSSTDLATWIYGGFVWTPTPGSWNARTERSGYWAPHVHASASEYWLYYTADSLIGVARADSPLGPFREMRDGPLVGDGNAGVGDGKNDGSVLSWLDDQAIDAYLLERADGSLYLYFSMIRGAAVIGAVRMKNYHTLSDEPAAVVLDYDVSGWEFVTREGPWIVEHDGALHLMYSGNTYYTTCYSVGDATSTEPMGPFVRRPDNPILHDDLAAGFFGPGHHAVVEGAHNDLLMFFHTKVSADEGGIRVIRYAPMTFDDAGNIRLDPPPPGDSAPGFNSCFPKEG